MNVIKEWHSKYKRMRSEWLRKTPKQKWDILYKYAEIVGQLTGIRTHVGKENYGYGWAGAIILVVCYFLIIYTILYNFRHHEYIRIIENCCSLGILTYVSKSFTLDLCYQ